MSDFNNHCPNCSSKMKNIGELIPNHGQDKISFYWCEKCGTFINTTDNTKTQGMIRTPNVLLDVQEAEKYLYAR